MVPDALRAIGVTVERKTDHFDQDTPDSVWLREVGKRRWIILSKDKSLTHNHIEIVELLKANTHSFLLTSGNFTAAEMANAFISAMREMQGIVHSTPAPVVASVSKSGNVRIRYTYDQLVDVLLIAQERESLTKDEGKPTGDTTPPPSS